MTVFVVAWSSFPIALVDNCMQFVMAQQRCLLRARDGVTWWNLWQSTVAIFGA